MIESIRSYIGEEANTSVWKRWGNDYVVRKMIRWIDQWKGMHLP